MKKILSLFLACLVLAGDLRAALTFGAATSDRVDCTSASSLDNLDPFTWLVVLYPTTLTDTRRILVKEQNSSTAGKRILLSGTTGDVSMFVNRATTATTYTTNDTPLGTTSKWYVLAATFDSTASAGQLVNIYSSNLTSALAERTYGTATDGSGALTNESAGVFYIGNRTTATLAFQGRIAVVMVWNRALSFGELQAQAFKPRKTNGNVLYVQLGYNGTGTQADWSGTGNNCATVTGATVSDHAPLPAPFATIFWRFWLRARPRPVTDFMDSDGALDLRRYLRNLDAPEISYGW